MKALLVATALIHALVALGHLLLMARRRDWRLPWLGALSAVLAVQAGWLATSPEWGGSTGIGLLGLASALLAAAGILLLAGIHSEMRRATRRADALQQEMKEYAHEASSQIETSERRLRHLGRASTVGVLEGDRGGAVVYASRRWCELTGMSEERALGRGWLEAVHPDDRAEVTERWGRAVEEQRDFEMEFRIAEEEPRWFLCQARPYQSTSDSAPGIVGTFSDTSQRRAAEAEQRRLEARVRNAQKLESLGVLAGGIAHDFNNLLTVILGDAEVMKARMKPGSREAGACQRIATAAQRAADLAEQLLAFSGHRTTSLGSVALSTLAEETVSLLQTTSSGTTVSLDVLPRELSFVEGDATQLRQLIMNLVLNALEACGEEGQAVRVETGLMEVDGEYLSKTYFDDRLTEGEYVYVEVTDTGCGMDPETLDRICDPFFTTKFTGRGLGLAVVLGIVRGHRAAIEIDSQPGQGTRVRVLFPTEEADAADAPVEDEGAACRAESDRIPLDPE